MKDIIEMCNLKIEITQVDMDSTADRIKLKKLLDKRDTLTRVVEDLENYVRKQF